VCVENKREINLLDVDGADGGTHLKKILRIAAGVGLILIGIVGLISAGDAGLDLHHSRVW
jgi:hypothetical protein